jgi:pimeloyl-ACP methyl ester carboxylesterase
MRLGILIVAVLPVIAGCQSAQRTGELVVGTTRSADGLQIVYDDRGLGDTTLVFVHCWACNRSYWREQLDAFADEYRVVSLDMGGHGASGAERDVWTIAGLADDVQAVVEQLKLKRVILVGHSLGGPVALIAAAQMPERVVGVVAVDTLHDAEFEYPPGMMEQMAQRFEADFAGTMALSVHAMFPQDADAELVEWVVAEAGAADPAVAVALLRDAPNFDARAALAAAGVPVRAVNAAPRPPSGMKTAVETNRKYADFNAVLIDGVGHFLMLERPGEVNARLRELIAELDAR